MKPRTVIDHRRTQTLFRGLAPRDCGCPATAATGKDCSKLREATGIGCLCACHRDEKSVELRRVARELLRGAGAA